MVLLYWFIFNHFAQCPEQASYKNKIIELFTILSTACVDN